MVQTYVDEGMHLKLSYQTPAQFFEPKPRPVFKHMATKKRGGGAFDMDDEPVKKRGKRGAKPNFYAECSLSLSLSLSLLLM